MNEPSLSALDRHAVLAGSNDSFPWFAGAMLAMEASEVIRLRLEKFAVGNEESDQEACLMVTEKIVAALQAGAQLLSGGLAQISLIVRQRHTAQILRFPAASAADLARPGYAGLTNWQERAKPNDTHVSAKLANAARKRASLRMRPS